MADYFTQTSFVVHADAEEAAILPEVDELLVALQDGFASPHDAMEVWQATSERFRRLFPADDPDKPFDRFTALFDDESFPFHGADIACRPDPESEARAILEVSGFEVDPVALANLLRVVLPSALPFRFGWAETCSRPLINAFGGGFIEVTVDRLIPLLGLGQDVERPRLVICVRDPDRGHLYWNNEAGFGALASATVHTPRDADEFRLPTANGAAPEWIELPPLSALLADMA